MRTVLLFLGYFLIVTPLGLARRLVHDPLSRRRKRRAATYWVAPLERFDLSRRVEAER